MLIIAVLNDVLISIEKSKTQLSNLAAKAKCNPWIQELIVNLECCSDKSKIIAENRNEDPDWFEGLRIN
jgi:hypothetical protein